MKYISKIIDSGISAFKSSDLEMILDIKNKSTLKSIIQRLKKDGLIIYHGHSLWSLKKYDPRELASKIRKKSYIGLETVLQMEGIIFQDYENTITLVSNNSLDISMDDKVYSFSKIKNAILSNPFGIITTGKYMISTKERAICDRIYLTPTYHFDNINKNTLDISLLEKLSTIYNKSTNLLIKKLLHDMK